MVDESAPPTGTQGTGEAFAESELERCWSRGWRAVAAARIERIHGDLRRCPQIPGVAAESSRAIVEDSLARAKSAAGLRNPDGISRRGRLRGVVSGARIDSTWRALNAADQELLMLLPPEVVMTRIAGVRAGLINSIPAGDTRLETYRADLDDLETPSGLIGALERISRWRTGAPRYTGADRARLRAIKRDIDDASDAAHEKVRSFRNLIFAFGFLITGFLLAVAAAHAGDPSFLRICEARSASPNQTVIDAAMCQNFADVATIEAVGALGGMVAGAITLGRLDTVVGAYSLPVYQAALRIPTGAIAALFGALVLQGGALGAFTPQDDKSLLAYAALFGYSQTLLLRLVDQHAKGILAQARGKQDPDSSPPSPKKT